MRIQIITADSRHIPYAQYICNLTEESARQRGTGIAKRSPEYVAAKMTEGKAVVAVEGEKVVGFSYIETWGHGKFVANSGLVVDHAYRNRGLAFRIKRRIFKLSREKYPNAKIFGLTTGLAVMKINSALGYIPVTFSELTSEEEFWKGCENCRNYDILQRNNRRMCLCTGMLYDPQKHQTIVRKAVDWLKMQVPRSHKIRYRWWMRRRAVKRQEQQERRAARAKTQI